MAETLIWRLKCGWCQVNQHDQCKPVIEHKEQKAESHCTCTDKTHPNPAPPHAEPAKKTAAPAVAEPEEPEVEAVEAEAQSGTPNAAN